jgi:hypothetical protein
MTPHADEIIILAVLSFALPKKKMRAREVTTTAIIHVRWYFP